MMNKVITSILIGFLAGVAVALLICTSVMPVKSARNTPKICPVVNKTEADGKYYLNVVLEVSGEEFIGYDIGDDITLYAD